MAKRNTSVQQTAELMEGQEAITAIHELEYRRVRALSNAYQLDFRSAEFAPYKDSVRVTVKFYIVDQPEAREGQTRVWKFCKGAFPSMWNERQWIDLEGGEKLWFVSWFINFTVKAKPADEGSDIPF